MAVHATKIFLVQSEFCSAAEAETGGTHLTVASPCFADASSMPFFTSPLVLQEKPCAGTPFNLVRDDNSSTLTQVVPKGRRS